MMRVEPIPAFSDNYIWLMHNDSGHCYVIDPGEASTVETVLDSSGMTLAGILVTHHHADHTGGISALTAQRDIPVYGPDNRVIRGITHYLGDGDIISVLDTEFHILATPGHTLDHIAYFAEPAERNPVLFCGDTLFAAGCGRLFEGTAEQMQLSLNKLNRLPKDTEIYCAHEYTQSNLAFAAVVEPDNAEIKTRINEVQELRGINRPTLPSQIRLEQQTNPFMRTSTPGVIAAAQQRSQPKLLKKPFNEADVLGVIREWKDNFQ